MLLGLAGCGGGGGDGNATSFSPDTPPAPDPPASASPPTLATQNAFVNLSFTRPVALKQAPGEPGRWYAVEQAGVVLVFDNDSSAASASVFVDISDRVDAGFGESGLLGLAFHPGYPTTPEVFLSYTASGAPLVSTLSRFRLDPTGLALDADSEEVLLQIAQPQGNHNGGDLLFDASGFLLAGFGDGGGSGDPDDNAQNTHTLLGSVIRIDVDGDAPYEIPSDNPFTGNDGCTGGAGSDPCAEIFAWGFRNPWRMSVDPATGELWVGDVGQGEWEEVDRVVPGGNYGWNHREGAHCFNPPSGCSEGFEEPVSEYDHDTGRSVTGGYVYRGAAIGNLVGWYVFADFSTGTLFAVDADARPTVEPNLVGDTGLNISAFAADADGELFLVSYGDGAIHRLVAAP